MTYVTMEMLGFELVLVVGFVLWSRFATVLLFLDRSYSPIGISWDPWWNLCSLLCKLREGVLTCFKCFWHFQSRIGATQLFPRLFIDRDSTIWTFSFLCFWPKQESLICNIWSSEYDSFQSEPSDKVSGTLHPFSFFGSCVLLPCLERFGCWVPLLLALISWLPCLDDCCLLPMCGCCYQMFHSSFLNFKFTAMKLCSSCVADVHQNSKLFNQHFKLQAWKYNQ